MLLQSRPCSHTFRVFTSLRISFIFIENVFFLSFLFPLFFLVVDNLWIFFIHVDYRNTSVSYNLYHINHTIIIALTLQCLQLKRQRTVVATALQLCSLTTPYHSVNSLKVRGVQLGKVRYQVTHWNDWGMLILHAHAH